MDIPSNTNIMPPEKENQRTSYIRLFRIYWYSEEGETTCWTWLWIRWQEGSCSLLSYFKQGDWVFTLVECPQHKFSKRWQGPFEITKKIDDHLYVIDLGSRDKLVNISKLKPYLKNKYSPAHLNIQATEFTPRTLEVRITLQWPSTARRAPEMATPTQRDREQK